MKLIIGFWFELLNTLMLTHSFDYVNFLFSCFVEDLNNEIILSIIN